MTDASSASPVSAFPGSPASPRTGGARTARTSLAGAQLPRVRRVSPPGREEERPALTVRPADPGDVEAARAMHARCSRRSLAQRYHGPAAGADRYLGHLLTPRHGHTLAATTPVGSESEASRLVALGHLLWDGEDSEVALLVEDAWQGRGVGTRLLRRLVALAVESGRPEVYAVTHASNPAMLAVLRGLGLPLHQQPEEHALVVSTRLPSGPSTGCGTDGDDGRR